MDIVDIHMQCLHIQETPMSKFLQHGGDEQRINTHSERRRLHAYTTVQTAGHQNKDNMPLHVSTNACHT